jgi:hypothetical protein
MLKILPQTIIIVPKPALSRPYLPIRGNHRLKPPFNKN